MRIRLSTLLLLFVILSSSLVLFGTTGGMVVFVCVSALWLARVPLVFFWMMLLLLSWLLIAIVTPLFSTAREADQRCACANNLKQIACVLWDYEQRYHSLPPPCVYDKSGRPMHSWRVLILPYLERKPLYDHYNLNEPWDGPNNKKLLAERPAVYACPEDREATDFNRTCTSYAAVVGSDAAWDTKKPRSLHDLHGASSTTLMVVEVADAGINWTEPRDLSIEAFQGSTTNNAPMVRPLSRHNLCDAFFYDSETSIGTNVAMADGSVHLLCGVLGSTVPQSILKIGGCTEQAIGAFVSSSPLRRTIIAHIHWFNSVVFAVWLVSSGLLPFRAVRSREKTAATPATEECQTPTP